MIEIIKKIITIRIIEKDIIQVYNRSVKTIEEIIMIKIDATRVCFW